MEDYHCEDCVACKDPDNPESVIYTCKFDGKELDFDVKTKTPCKRFIPAEYVKALNFDTR